MSGIETTATSAPYKPWWESATFYYSQWMGLDPAEWECYNRDEETQECDFNDVVARPMYSRWQHSGTGQDAVYISWHTNGYDGNVRGTTSYIHNGDTYPVTEGSPELAAAVHTELVSDIRAGWDPQWADRGVGQLNLGELRLLWDDDPATRMPGALLEIAFHDNPDDANALKDPRFGQLSARAIYQGIVKYFENRDHVNLVLAPEPPTHVSARNLGSSRVRVDWVASPVDAVGLRGEAATGYRVYTSPDGLAWALAAIAADTEATLGPLTAGQKLYVRVSATNAGGESLPTEALGVRVGETAPILIVNGFDKLNRFELVSQYDPTMGWNLRMWLDQINRRAYVIHHGDAIPAEYAWDSASNEAVADGLVDPRLYGVVDWILGEEATEEEGTLSYAERAVIQAYLDANRALLISGAEMAWDLEGMGRAPAFLNETLHTDYVADDALTYAVAPVAGGAFAGLPAFGFDAPGEYDVGYPDVLGGLSGATPSLTYSGGTGGAAALQYAAGCRRLLVFGFPFETIRPAMRGPVMASALAYLGVCALTETTITAPVPGTYYSSTPAFAGTAVGVGLSRVEVLVRRGTDGYYWNGASWVSSPVWVVATGASSWSYPLPALSDGSYTVQARAVGYSTDLTPALVMFGVDSVAPGTPTPISPAGGVTLLSPSVTLSWSQPPDTGSPLRYRIEVNSRVYVAPASPYQVGLPSGEYAWRLRAEDSAGNASAWSASAAFAVEVQEAYLPLLMRGR